MLSEKLAHGKIITLEILLPTTLQANSLFNAIEPLRDYVDALNIPSNPLGKLRPDALCYAHLIQENMNIETIPHFVARHFTSLSFESHLLGAAALGIENILCVTGDSPAEGRSMFEMNAIRLLDIAQNLKHGLTSSRRAIKPVNLCLCTSFNPNVPNIQGEFIKAREKSRFGAEIFFTQAIFKPEQFLEILREFRREHMSAKVIAGLLFLYTKKRAFSLMKFLGIPYEYISLIEEKDETAILLQTAEKLKNHVDGFYVIPIAQYTNALDLIKKMKRIL